MSSINECSEIELFNIASYLPISSVITLCQVNKKFRKLVYDNEFYWKYRYIENYNTNNNPEKKWKILCMDFLKVWTFGSNMYGQLGFVHESKFPRQIENIKSEHIAAGPLHTMFVDLNNYVWVFGNNSSGQLGLGDEKERYIPTKIQNMKAIQISASKMSHRSYYDNDEPPKTHTITKSHSIIIDFNNDVWVFGCNQYGQLGLSDHNDRNIPTKIPNIKAKQVSAGGHHTVLIDLNNDVWSFGSNRFGQLGLSDNIDRLEPTKIPNLKAKKVSAGHAHTVVLDLNHEIWTFGFGLSGQLGHGDNKDKLTPTKIKNFKAKDVITGPYQTMFIEFNDNIRALGENGCGQLGNVSGSSSYYYPFKISNLKAKQISIGVYHTIVIDLNNEIWLLGHILKCQLSFTNDKYDRTKIHNMNASHVSCGCYHTIILAKTTN